MKKLGRILVLYAPLGFVVLTSAACGSEDTASKGTDSNVTSTTAGLTTGGTPTTGPTTTSAASSGTTGLTSTSSGVGVTTTGAAASSGTSGVPVTTGTTGTTGGTTGSAGAGGTSSSSSASVTAGDGVTSSTTGGAEDVLCDTTLTGEDYYARPQSCAHCHGADALGTEDGPEVRHPSADYLRWIVREGRMDHPDFPDGMPPVPEECLTDSMIEEIIVFLNAFPEPTTGAELYADYCASCHGEDGLGGVTGISLDRELHENAEIAVSGNDTMNYGDRASYMPGQGDRLTAAEIQLITDYLQNELGLAF